MRCCRSVTTVHRHLLCQPHLSGPAMIDHWTSSTPSSFQVREVSLSILYTSSSQRLGGMMYLIHTKSCSCHLVHLDKESLQMLCKSLLTSHLPHTAGPCPAAFYPGMCRLPLVSFYLSSSTEICLTFNR